ncbi:MAG TPA: sugar phosphorylase [Anaerolineales bacterium]|jgi:sucrose phosphorylase
MTDPSLPLSLLSKIYGSEAARPLWQELRARLSRARHDNPPRPPAWLTQKDAMLISYGDQVSAPGVPPLASLADFCRQHLGGKISSLHILPFYPSSSDDGFAVKDYRQVDPALGSWDDIARLSVDFQLMFDAVINHVSARGRWFRAFLRDEQPYRDYFITVDGSPDLSQVVRPRTLPLLTRFGGKDVWTTFSADQVDLNYQNPQVLLEIIDLLLFYAAQGAEFIRLDAIAYLWKEPGTSCIHLPQTHAIIQLFRAVLDEAAPNVRLITETNVPHLDNIAYFGDGSNEAQLVYNFALPPLVLHTLQTADSRALTTWAGDLSLPGPGVTFFNFLASHDGIGLNPVRGILPEKDIQALVKRALAHKGLVSYKQNPDGSQSPYELNINYFDALSDPQGSEPLNLQVGRFMAAQAILLSMVGMPGIYFHSLFGSRGWRQGPEQTGSNRSINRQKLTRKELENDLAHEDNLRHVVFSSYANLLRARASSPAFDPYGLQTSLNCGRSIFGLLRKPARGGERVLCLQNISPEAQSVSLDQKSQSADLPARLAGLNLVTGSRAKDFSSITLAPYETVWLALDA